MPRPPEARNSPEWQPENWDDSPGATWKVFLAGDFSKDFCHQQLGCQPGWVYTELWPTERQGVRACSRRWQRKPAQVSRAATVSWNVVIWKNDSTAKCQWCFLESEQSDLAISRNNWQQFEFGKNLCWHQGRDSLPVLKTWMDWLVVRLTSVIFWCFKKKKNHMSTNTCQHLHNSVNLQFPKTQCISFQAVRTCFCFNNLFEMGGQEWGRGGRKVSHKILDFMLPQASKKQSSRFEFWRWFQKRISTIVWKGYICMKLGFFWVRTVLV